MRTFDDPLFESFPVSGTHTLGSGLTCQSPFFVPRASGWMVFGTANWDVLDGWMADTPYVPIRASNGAGLACIWLTDFGDSTVGPYRELTITFYVAREVSGRRPLTIPWRGHLTPLLAHFHPGARICEYVLVLDNQGAIDYGRELHGFDKHLGVLTFDPSPTRRSASRVRVSEGDQVVVEGELPIRASLWSRLRALRQLFATLGPRRAVARIADTLHRAPVVTPTRVRSCLTDIYFTGKASLCRFGKDDWLTFRAGSWIGDMGVALGFEPLATQILVDVKGIMPLPVAAHETGEYEAWSREDPVGELGAPPPS